MSSELTFGSLFSGIGGIDLGLNRAGMVCEWQVEIEPYCQRVLAKHWPNVRRHDDITTFVVDAARTAEWKVDLIAGGFPCQDLSAAGKRAGITGSRSGLFFEMLRVVRILRPRYVLVENVPGLLVHPGMDTVVGELAASGYDCEWDCIPAAAVGAPHIRDRVWIVAHDTHPDRPRSQGRNGQVLRERAGERPVGAGCSSHAGDADHWRVEPSVGRVAHGIPARVDRLRALGNSVVPQVVEWIGRRIVNMQEVRREQ